MRPASGRVDEPSAAAASAPRRPPRLPPRLSLRNRYSMFVGLMKVLLPAMAAGLVLLTLAWPQFTKQRDSFRLSVSNIGSEQIETLSMVNARFDGIDAKSQPYTITADVATQSPRDDSLIDLERPKGDLTLTDGAWLALTANTGRYDRQARALDLLGAVSLFHDRGFELLTEAARIDLAQGTARGDRPVQVHGTAGSIDAEGFRVLDRGQRIIFTGRSHLTLLPAAKETLQ